MKSQRIPTKITLDAYALPTAPLPKRVRVRTTKYLNNRIEQDHGRVKQRLRPMLGRKSFRTAVVVIAGVELAEKIKKRQFKISKLDGSTATMPQMWQAALWC
jgi:transposase-like protein